MLRKLHLSWGMPFLRLLQAGVEFSALFKQKPVKRKDIKNQEDRRNHLQTFINLENRFL